MRVCPRNCTEARNGWLPISGRTGQTGSRRNAVRWQIEVKHRDEKDTLGVGQAQVRSAQSVPRQPAFVVAAYSALLLAGILAYGPDRGAVYPDLPKWRRSAKRPSCLDLIAVLRMEMTEQPAILNPLGFSVQWKTLVTTAAA